MSSILRKPALLMSEYNVGTRPTQTPSQLEVRTKYFIATANYDPEEEEGVANPTPDDPAITFDAYPGPLVIGTIPTVGYVGFSKCDLFRDMGQQVIFVDPVTYEHLSVYRRVQKVDGVNSEGVSGITVDNQIYLRVWAKDGTNVRVARTG
jgi:hypothetical protein